MEHTKYRFMVVISSLLTILAFAHLAQKVYVTKDATNLTFVWILLVLSAQILLVVHGILNKSSFIYIPATILTICIIYILYIKLHTFDNKIEALLKTKNILFI
jgi:uncharacterized protein with PQ loop repeat